MTNPYPVLYSFRRCPYAMRARLVLYACKIKCELREVVLRDKPDEMLKISAKGTVPVLQLADGTVIDESHDIICWAINENDPHCWKNYLDEMNALVEVNDFKFKLHLDKYKYSSRNKELSREEHRKNGEFFLELLEKKLESKSFLSASQMTVTDLAIFPFIRQFAFVDKNYFDNLPYPKLQNWLEWHLKSDIFKNIMYKYDQWKPGNETIYFP
ncbi:MAG: glutathione S-transferase [Kordiimonadaceae bacterium]|nr:glutathione S-transferase [Kordiimonadaceae bacterium]